MQFVMVQTGFVQVTTVQAFVGAYPKRIGLTYMECMNPRIGRNGELFKLRRCRIKLIERTIAGEYNDVSVWQANHSTSLHGYVLQLAGRNSGKRTGARSEPV